MDKIYSEELNFPGFPPMFRPTLHKWAIKLGFVCKNMKLKVYQRMDIVVQRQIYLRKLRDLRASEYKIFYQDETWCNANHTRQYVWQARGDDNIISDTVWKGGADVPSGNGQRIL